MPALLNRAFAAIAVASLLAVIAVTQLPARNGEAGVFAVTAITADCDGSGTVTFTGEIPAGGLTLTVMTKAPDNSGSFFPSPDVPVLTFTDGTSPLAYQFDLSNFDEKHYRVDSNFNTKSPSLDCEGGETPTVEATPSPQITPTLDVTTETPEATGTPTPTATSTSSVTTTATASATSTPVNTSTPTEEANTKTATRTSEAGTSTPDTGSTPAGTVSPVGTPTLVSTVLGSEPQQGSPTDTTTVLGLPRAGVGVLRDNNFAMAGFVLLVIAAVGAGAFFVRTGAMRRQ